MNRKKKGPARAGRAAEEEDRNAYIGSVCAGVRGSTWGRETISFGTYNIRNGLIGGLELALRGMFQANMDLGIFQENNLTGGVYTRGSAGCSVVATEAPG